MGPLFRQEGGTGLKNRKQNLGQVFRQDRGNPVLLENLSQDLFLVFYSCSTFLSETRPQKSLSRETCLDLEIINKNLSVSLFFCRQDAEPRQALSRANQDNNHYR